MDDGRSGAFNVIYNGTNTEYNVTVPTSGFYRVYVVAYNAVFQSEPSDIKTYSEGKITNFH